MYTIRLVRCALPLLTCHRATTSVAAFALIQYVCTYVYMHDSFAKYCSLNQIRNDIVTIFVALPAKGWLSCHVVHKTQKEISETLQTIYMSDQHDELSRFDPVHLYIHELVVTQFLSYQSKISEHYILIPYRYWSIKILFLYEKLFYLTWYHCEMWHRQATVKGIIVSLQPKLTFFMFLYLWLSRLFYFSRFDFFVLLFLRPPFRRSFNYGNHNYNITFTATGRATATAATKFRQRRCRRRCALLYWANFFFLHSVCVCCYCCCCSNTLLLIARALVIINNSVVCRS